MEGKMGKERIRRGKRGGWGKTKGGTGRGGEAGVSKA